MTAETARERLADALDELDQRGGSWPCRDDDGWTSEDHDDRAEAARRCAGCSVIALCAAAAEEGDERWGVWAGTDRGARPRKASA